MEITEQIVWKVLELKTSSKSNSQMKLGNIKDEEESYIQSWISENADEKQEQNQEAEADQEMELMIELSEMIDIRSVLGQ